MTEDIINKVPNPPFPVEIIDTVPVEVATHTRARRSCWSP